LKTIGIVKASNKSTTRLIPVILSIFFSNFIVKDFGLYKLRNCKDEARKKNGWNNRASHSAKKPDAVNPVFFK
jgi:hypothetical protein